MTTPIKLTDLIKIEDPCQYKLHLACVSPDGEHPLNEYVADRKNWIGWNEYRGDKNHWTRPYIISFMEFYPITNSYLFGGIFKVKDRLPENYVLEEVTEFEKWEGRLICLFHRYQGLRGRHFFLEKLLDSFEVLQVLPEKYNGEPFCGYENINHIFGELKGIIQKEKHDWKGFLTAVKGVYLIIDTKNGKSYVGSAYSEGGIWSRLVSYIISGHGGNDELVQIIKEKGLGHALAYFKFSVLEVFTFNTPDDVICKREAHWKKVMLSREFGYNKN